MIIFTKEVGQYRLIVSTLDISQKIKRDGHCSAILSGRHTLEGSWQYDFRDHFSALETEHYVRNFIAEHMAYRTRWAHDLPDYIEGELQ